MLYGVNLRSPKQFNNYYLEPYISSKLNCNTQYLIRILLTKVTQQRNNYIPEHSFKRYITIQNLRSLLNFPATELHFNKSNFALN